MTRPQQSRGDVQDVLQNGRLDSDAQGGRRKDKSGG